MPRPTVLTGELQDIICGLISAGNHVETACRMAGVSTSSYYNWLNLGQNEQAGRHANFAAAVAKAEAEAESNAVALVQGGMKNDPRLAMTFLERRFPSRWQKQHATEKNKAKEIAESVRIEIIDVTDELGKTRRVLAEEINDADSDGADSDATDREAA